MAAFRAAVELGITHLETDVHATSDGVAVLFHDETLDRITDRGGRISELSYAELAEARIGGTEPIPRLDELLAEFPDVRLNVDVKARSSVQPLVDVVERYGAHHRVLVASFSDRRRRSVLRQLSRRTASSAGIVSTVLFTVLGPVVPREVLRHWLHDVDALQVPERFGVVPVVGRGFLRRAHALGVEVHVWTVNDPADMHRLLGLGVDGLVTDRADLLLEVMKERGERERGDRSGE